METSFFIATKFPDSGWTVITPWITTLEGSRYRHHIEEYGFGIEAEKRARHLAKELNVVTRLLEV